MERITYVLTVVYFIFTGFAIGQVGINNSNPKAMLHIVATDSANPLQTDGLMLPKISTFPSTNPTSDQLGMIVYLTNNLSGFIVDTTAKNYNSGFYFWDSSKTDWIPFVLNNAWKLSGNNDAVSGTDFIGTTNSEEVDFRVNNKLVTRLTELGQFELMAEDRSVFIGFEAGENYDASSSAEQDTFIGYNAGTNTTTGRDNTAVGAFALRDNDTGGFNTAIGDEALLSNVNGFRNTALGGASQRNNISGNRNTAIGFDAVRNNTNGEGNTGIGNDAMRNGNGFSNSTALGNRAGINNSGDNTTSIGAYSLENSGSGNNNTAIGAYALRAATNGNNVAVGANAGDNITTGTNNVLIGTNTNATSGSLNNTTAVGYNASARANNTVSIGSNAYASGSDAVAIGDDAGAEDSWAIAIGEFSRATAEDAIALGHRSTVLGHRGTALGLNADIGAGGSHAVAIGVNSNALHTRSIAFGPGAVTTADNQLKISNNIFTIDASNSVITAESYVATVGSGTGYADYVFDIYYEGRSDLTTSYKFPTLEEAEKFVKINGHLIGVKSIEDIKDQGMTVNVTEVSLKNLEKLEEQFLYITELNSRLIKTEELLKIHENKLNNLINIVEKLGKQ